MPRINLATSKIIKSNNINKKIWVNPDPTTAVGDGHYQVSLSQRPFLVIAKYRIYNNTTGGIYFVQSVYSDNETSQSLNLVTSIRWDGSNNYLLGRNTSYDFATNTLHINPCYRQDTYKATTLDNNGLIPTEIICYY